MRALLTVFRKEFAATGFGAHERAAAPRSGLSCSLRMMNEEIPNLTAFDDAALDKAFGGARSYLRIGNGNQIREHYTISRGTQPESVTKSATKITS